LLVAACASDDTSSPDATTSGSTPVTASSTTSSTSAPVTARASTAPPDIAAPETTVAPPVTDPDDGIVRVAIAVSGGDTTIDDDRVEVPLGATVEITVAADVTDDVHVHGYDVFGDVTPASPAVITFTADIPGLFEVELEDAGLLLVELQVS
jgi:hypothetical protein